MSRKTTEIILFGIENAGKTAFARRVEKKSFSSVKRELIGLQCSSILSKDEAPNVTTWDYNGQKRFENMLRVYIIPINLVALFVDLTKIDDSIEAFKGFKKAGIREKGIPCVLIYTKSDLVDETKLTPEAIDDHCRRIAENLDIDLNQIKEHFITSAKDNINIDKTREYFFRLHIRAPAFNIKWDYIKDQPRAVSVSTSSVGFFDSLLGRKSNTTPSTNTKPPPIEYHF